MHNLLPVLTSFIVRVS